jgi:single-strand DNA-binding protein
VSSQQLTSESSCHFRTRRGWKNDKGDYENRTERHRVYVWRNLSKLAKTLQKGQLVTLESILRHREVEDEVKASVIT